MLEQIVKKLTAKPEKKFVAAERPDEDFIPYVCHYDNDTVLTKNGELLQVIRVTGLSDSNIALDLISLRDSIRDAIYDNAQDEKFAFWFHTIRRKKSLINKDDLKFSDDFCRNINEKWVIENDLEDQFVNEFYISIITEGLDTSITDSRTLMKSFSYKTIQNLHHQHLADSSAKLTKLTKSILLEIESHGAKTLGIKDWEGVLYSEPMRFFGKIINLYEGRYPLSANDISSDLSSHKIAFGTREIEVLGKKNKNFAATMSIKEYHEVSVESLDKILSLPFEFIIAQSFDFTCDKEEIEEYKYNNHILEISGDEDFRKIAGYDNFIKSEGGKETDYGKLQSSLTIISNNRDHLEEDVMLATEEFSALGYVLVREDVFLEHCFWAQLPANFAFLRRQKIINTLRVPGFAALHSFPSGSFDGNHWGPAITVFKTVVGTPYFFNFHEQDLGHALIFGPKSSGKTVLTNFLVSQAQKLDARVFYFDFNRSSKCFIKAMSGDYYDLEDPEGEDFLKMNPLSLQKNQENSEFLFTFVKQLLMFLKARITDREMQNVHKVLDQALAVKSPNFLLAFDALRGQETRNAYEKLKIWGNGKLSHIFGAQDEIDWQNPVIGFDLGEVINQKPILTPVMMYLLHKIESLLDGTKAIIVIDECFEFLDNPAFHEILGDILQRLRRKNCVVIFNSPDHLYVGESKLSKPIIDNVATEVYLPNSNPKQYYRDILGLEEDELGALEHMSQDNSYRALLKHGSDSLIIDNDFSFYDDLLSVLSCDEVTLAALEEVLTAKASENNGKIPDSSQWIPDLLAILAEIRKQKIVEKQKIENIEAAKKDSEDDGEFEIDKSLEDSFEDEEEDEDFI